MNRNNIILALKSLNGLRVGDCIGQAVIKKKISNITDLEALENGSLPYTDDSEQAKILYDHVLKNNDVVPDELVTELYEGYNNSNIKEEYGGRTKKYFNDILNNNLVYPANSFGNGCLMRIVPSICYFYKNKKILEKLLGTCVYTHNNIESFEAVTLLVTFVSDLIWGYKEIKDYFGIQNTIIKDHYLPRSLKLINSEVIKKEINKIIDNELFIDIKDVVKLVGNGRLATVFDTLPFCLWVIMRNINDYKGAIKECMVSGGDIDTNCAIVGAAVSIFDDVPKLFIDKCKKI